VLAEAVLLASVGGAAGLGVAAGFAAIVRNSRLDFTIPILVDLRLDARVVLFTLVLSVATGVLFGLLPALRATRRDVNATLRDDATSIGARRRPGLTGLLVGGQVAISLLLLGAASMFVENLLRAEGTDPGFDWEQTAYVQVNASALGLEDEALLILFERIEERLEGLPGVRGAATALQLPGAQFGTTTLLLGAEVTGADRPTEIPWNYVTPDFFEVMDVELLDGRVLEEADGETGAAVVSEAFARTYFGRTDAAGATFRSEGSPDRPLEIIGVVRDATVRSLGEAPTPSLYWPLDFAYPRVNFIVSTDGDPTEVVGALGAVVREADARILVLAMGTLADHLGDTLRQERMASSILVGLGGLALLLAMLGIYGVVSFAVSRRRREVGIRIALGAGGGSVVRLFVRDVALVVLVGTAVGLALFVPLARVAGGFTGSGGSLPATVAVAGLLVGTSLLATLLPAFRATRTDPTDALRQE
jgi:predicted permease